MKRIIISFLIGGILGTGAGVGIGFFIYPFIFPPPPAAEMLVEADRSEVVAKGTFIHADPSDPIHYGSGAVTVYETVVFLEPDFKVGPGPKYHVYLVPEETVTPDTAVDETMFVDLGRLRSFEGSQRYPIPSGTDLSRYPHVVIWCEQFGVLISPAKLMF